MRITGLLTALTLVFLTGFYSCDIINPVEDIPAYINIDTFLVSVDNFEQGSAGHMITDIWISAGGKTLGTFVMPFTVPSLEVGMQTLTIRPGIKVNGISASRAPYPFYKPFIVDMELIPGEIYTVSPKSTYKPECKFPYIEDFEDPGIGFIYPDYSDTIINVQRDQVREGRSSGAIFLTKEDSVFEAYFSKDLTLPENASDVYLEFDYKNNSEFQVGMYLIESGVITWYGLVGVRPSDTWKRMYIDLGTITTYQFETDQYRIAFGAAYDQEDESVTTEIYLDNIKVIHY